MNHSDVWVLAEQKNGKVQRVTFELLTRGLDLAEKSNGRVSVMLFGNNIGQEALQAIIDCGASRLVYVEDAKLEHFLIEPYSVVMVDVIEKFKPSIILAGATTMGRTLMPYVAIKTDTGLTADCTILDIEPETGNLLQTRPAIGGNIMATIHTPNHRPQMATVRPRSTPPAQKVSSPDGEIIKVTPKSILTSRITFEKLIPNEEEVSLADADTVVAIGRGIKKKDNLQMIYDLAHELNAAVGATRDVVDRGWLSYPHQVGLSGQTISPKLYIAIGLSGSIQHIAGVQTSETIVAVNKDPDAQIFKIADYGMTGDLFEVVPMMIEQAKKGKLL
jgi:electron transfer flavoprotein alpha subunit